MTEAERHALLGYEPAAGLSALSADELAERLKDHVERPGGLICGSDLAVPLQRSTALRRTPPGGPSPAAGLLLAASSGEGRESRAGSEQPGPASFLLRAILSTS
jgi:hypothetical protein